MHMSDALLSAATGSVMSAVSAGFIGYSVVKIKKTEIFEKKVPIMAVSGAFIFAAQMINFAIPGTGSSGHISGGILLAALLGSNPALLTISAILVIQSLFFADGGLLALGCNIFNLGVIPCLLVYPFLFKPFVKRNLNNKTISIASVIAVVVGLQLGAFAVVLQTQAAGISQLPFATFTLLMQPIHLAIGIFEGIITAAVLCFVYKMRPEILENSNTGQPVEKTISFRNVIIAFAVLAVFTGGLLSIFASQKPDGLEWAIEETAGVPELEINDPFLERAADIQETLSFMPDYNFKTDNEDNGNVSMAGTSVAGITGSILTFILAGGTALIITGIKKKRRHGHKE